MTTNVYYGRRGGSQFVPGTYHTFGNNGTTPYNGSVATGPDTALNNDLATNGPVFISATSLYHDLANASDHLPVVADYSVPIPAPVFAGAAHSPRKQPHVQRGRWHYRSGVYRMDGDKPVVAGGPKLGIRWRPTFAPAGNFTLTVTNASGSGASAGFYLLRTQ